mmetsp:Transcript_44608/g.116007  ORF Transcript_44608/g.116007 Transcript_44608/m.116007 type:complete len:279 (+) Transcript_44608:36-872(+)
MPNFSNFSGWSIGYRMVSCSARLVSSRPPMSSHFMLGTSTTVSRREDGLHAPMATLKCSCVTAMESRISASIVSSSRSMRSIFSRMHCSAASVQSCARSAPTKPWVFDATSSSFTSGASFMFFVWILRTSRRPLSSGTPMSSSRSKRPKRRRAWSMVLGLLVAAMTTVWLRPFMPSMSVSICETTLFSTSPLVLSRFGAIESISSMKMIHGAFFFASAKRSRTREAPMPAKTSTNSAADTLKNGTPASPATAFASSVFPVPGGPTSSAPLGILAPSSA